jgi:hypothetical protein
VSSKYTPIVGFNSQRLLWRLQDQQLALRYHAGPTSLHFRREEFCHDQHQENKPKKYY